VYRRSFLALTAASLLSAGVSATPTRRLIVIHLFGGNDGLNTIVPLNHPRYRRLRPTLALSADEIVGTKNGLGFHRALSPALPIWEAGRLAIVNGVGYPGPDRSHFRSSAIWETAGRPTADSGWLGTCLAKNGGAAVSLDPTLPFSLRDKKLQPLCLPRLQSPKFPDWSAIDQMYRAPEQPAHLRATYDRLRGATRRLARRAPPSDAFPQSLKALCDLLPDARVAHLRLGGFDTHSDQRKRHAEILHTLAEGLATLWRDLERRGMARDTLVIGWSEFGRRAAENASGGTDHGAAGPLFLMGNGVRGGFHGEIPSLDDLDDGDLKYAVDFRRAYATVLERWMGADAAAILGRRFEPLNVLC